MVSRQSVVAGMSTAGLERAARMAGEAFGHEEGAPLPRLPSSTVVLQHLAAAFAAIATLTLIGLLVLN